MVNGIMGDKEVYFILIKGSVFNEVIRGMWLFMAEYILS